MWWKEIAALKQRLHDVQQELEIEQGKAVRIAGFISRLQRFGVSPTGQVPRREFAEALMDAVAALLKAEQVVFFQVEPVSLELLPTAARGVSPEVLARLRVRPGEGVLGRAAASMKNVLQNSMSESREENFFEAPFLIIPLVSQAACSGLLLIAQPQEGPFGAHARELASVFAAQASLMIENHAFYQGRQELCSQTIRALIRAIEARDSYTHKHSDRTRALVRAFTQELSLPEFLTQEIESGAILHDLGKIGIEDAILRKTGELTAQEYDAMKKHATLGHRILQPIDFLRRVGAVVLYHQEWYNGAGYPEGLVGEEIPLGARVVQIIDAWDAMTSDRPYRKAMPKSAAIAELRRQQGIQFDPKLVDLFLRMIDRLEREGVSTTELQTA